MFEGSTLEPEDRWAPISSPFSLCSRKTKYSICFADWLLRCWWNRILIQRNLFTFWTEHVALQQKRCKILCSLRLIVVFSKPEPFLLFFFSTVVSFLPSIHGWNFSNDSTYRSFWFSARSISAEGNPDVRPSLCQYLIIIFFLLCFPCFRCVASSIIECMGNAVAEVRSNPGTGG